MPARNLLLTGLTGLIGLLPAGLPVIPPPESPRIGPLTVENLSGVVYTAHRGGALEAPENSMAALERASRLGGVQILDVDVRMLKDGTLVAMHDATLDRTTTTTGPVRKLTAQEWQNVRLRVPEGLGGSWREERPPTVAEVLDRFGGQRVLMLEAKDPDSLDGLAKQIHARKLGRSVFVNTNHPEVARKAKKLGLVAQLWRSRKQLRNDRPKQWAGFVQALDVDYRARDEDLRRAVDSGIPRVWAHTVNTAADRDRVLGLGCNGVISDAPALLTGPAAG